MKYIVHFHSEGACNFFKSSYGFIDQMFEYTFDNFDDAFEFYKKNFCKVFILVERNNTLSEEEIKIILDFYQNNMDLL
jgi:hypothetical protein